MKIPNRIRVNDRKYIFIKEYERYILYQDKETGFKECFNRQELGLIKKQPKVVNISPNKVVI
jgi:hypothetical protein